MKSRALGDEARKADPPQVVEARQRLGFRESLFMHWCIFSFAVLLLAYALVPANGHVTTMTPLCVTLGGLLLFESWAVLSLLAKRAGGWSRLRFDRFVLVPLGLSVTMLAILFIALFTYCGFNRCSFS